MAWSACWTPGKQKPAPKAFRTPAAFRARFLYPEGHDYFATLREKLHWSATPELDGHKSQA